MTSPYETWGTGDIPVVFLHGFTGSKASWRHLESRLGPTVRATCFDLPGHADARPVEGGFVAAVDELARNFNGPCAVVGYSQGARVALALAVRYPHLVTQLVLESGTAGVRHRRDRATRRAHDARLAADLLGEGLETFIVKWEAQPMFTGLRALGDDAQQALAERRRAHNPSGLAWALREMGQGSQPSYWQVLPRVRTPTLVLCGARDVKYSRLARRMVAGMPLAWTRSFETVGHAPHLECADEYAQEVSSFVTAGFHAAEVVP